jgi:hypothetical protein
VAPASISLDAQPEDVVIDWFVDHIVEACLLPNAPGKRVAGHAEDGDVDARSP